MSEWVELIAEDETLLQAYVAARVATEIVDGLVGLGQQRAIALADSNTGFEVSRSDALRLARIRTRSGKFDRHAFKCDSQLEDCLQSLQI